MSWLYLNFEEGRDVISWGSPKNVKEEWTLQTVDGDLIIRLHNCGTLIMGLPLDKYTFDSVEKVGRVLNHYAEPQPPYQKRVDIWVRYGNEISELPERVREVLVSSIGDDRAEAKKAHEEKVDGVIECLHREAEDLGRKTRFFRA